LTPRLCSLIDGPEVEHGAHFLILNYPQRRWNSCEIVRFGFGTARQRMVLERWTNPKRSRRMCSPCYGVRVAPGTRYNIIEGIRRASRNGSVSDLPPETPNVTIRNFFHRRPRTARSARTVRRRRRRRRRLLHRLPHPRGAVSSWAEEEEARARRSWARRRRCATKTLP
jgi:hypothetical protein